MERETVPANHLLALVKDAPTADAVAADLKDHGFEDPIVIHDEDVGERLQEEMGTIERLISSLWGGHVSEEPAYLAQYEQAAREGASVVAVKADNEDAVREAQAILEEHQAVNIRFFGRLAVQDLTPDSNPSAGSEEPPRPNPTESS